MYQFELKLDAATAAEKTLQLLENICDQYQLNDDFGTISLAAIELIYKVLEENGGHEVGNLFVVVENQKLTVTIAHGAPLSALKKQLETASEMDTDSAFFTIKKLTDKLEFKNFDREISLEFSVNPNLAVDNNERAAILQQTQKIGKKSVISC